MCVGQFPLRIGPFPIHKQILGRYGQWMISAMNFFLLKNDFYKFTTVTANAHYVSSDTPDTVTPRP